MTIELGTILITTTKLPLLWTSFWIPNYQHRNDCGSIDTTAMFITTSLTNLVIPGYLVMFYISANMFYNFRKQQFPNTQYRVVAIALLSILQSTLHSSIWIMGFTRDSPMFMRLILQWICPSAPACVTESWVCKEYVLYSIVFVAWKHLSQIVPSWFPCNKTMSPSSLLRCIPFLLSTLEAVSPHQNFHLFLLFFNSFLLHIIVTFLTLAPLETSYDVERRKMPSMHQDDKKFSADVAPDGYWGHWGQQFSALAVTCYLCCLKLSVECSITSRYPLKV